MTPSVSTLQRLTMQEHRESLGPLDDIREAEDIPQDAVTASLDGVMVALRAGEGGRSEACWRREAACGTASFHDTDGERLKTVYLGRMPEGRKHTLKAQLANEVEQAETSRYRDQRRRRCRQLDLPQGSQARNRGDRLACEHLRVTADHAAAPHWFEKYREILRHDPRGIDRVDPGAAPPSRHCGANGPMSTGNCPSSASIATECATTR